MIQVKRHHKIPHKNKRTIRAASGTLSDANNHQQNMNDLDEFLQNHEETSSRLTPAPTSVDSQTDMDADLFDDLLSPDDTPPPGLIDEVDPWNDVPSTRDGDEVNTSDDYLD